jgi:hypothetical protein
MAGQGRRGYPTRQPSNIDLIFEQCAILPRVAEEEIPLAPEGVKRVRMVSPYHVAHAGTAYWPGETPVVPESLAAEWIRSKWVVAEGDQES